MIFNRAISSFAARNKVATVVSQWEEVRSMASSYMSGTQHHPGEISNVQFCSRPEHGLGVNALKADMHSMVQLGITLPHCRESNW